MLLTFSVCVVLQRKNGIHCFNLTPSKERLELNVRQQQQQMAQKDKAIQNWSQNVSNDDRIWFLSSGRQLCRIQAAHNKFICSLVMEHEHFGNWHNRKTLALSCDLSLQSFFWQTLSRCRCLLVLGRFGENKDFTIFVHIFIEVQLN